MDNNQLKHMAELALIRAIPGNTIKGMKPGRLRGLYLKLVKEIDKQLASLPTPTESEIKHIGGALTAFGLSTGWEGKSKHVATMVSFVLGMIEDSDSYFTPKTVKILNGIVDYFDRAGKVNGLCFFGGGVAAEKWDVVIQEFF